LLDSLAYEEAMEEFRMLVEEHHKDYSLRQK
jgi:hypothetical protein